MKNVLLLLILLLSGGMWAQTYSDESTSVEVDEVNLQDEDATIPVIFASLGIDTSPNPRNATLQGSQVFLQQIGDFNVANIQVTAAASEIGLLQNGNGNNADLTYDVQTVITTLQQNGDDNVITDFVLNPQENISLDLQQNGNNLTFERQGANALTRSLKFVQTQASPTLIVRSFN